MQKLPFETATEEFKKWADSKMISNKVIEKHQDDADAIIDALQQGNLSLDEETNDLIQFLFFPKGETTELRYRSRVSKGELSASTRGLRSDNIIGEMPICYVSCLTGKDKGTIRALDSTDSSLGEHIAAFFLI